MAARRVQVLTWNRLAPCGMPDHPWRALLLDQAAGRARPALGRRPLPSASCRDSLAL